VKTEARAHRKFDVLKRFWLVLPMDCVH
jgi:hypothetical protein